jgi:hypothetical protein
MLLMSLLLLGSCYRANGHAKISPSREQERLEAIGLLQLEMGRGPFIPEAAIDSMISTLRLVRRAFPEIADITESGDQEFPVRLSDTLGVYMGRRFPDGWEGDTIVSSTGIPVLDSLNASLKVEKVWAKATAFGRRTYWLLAPEFPRPIYWREVADMYSRIPGVGVWVLSVRVDGGEMSAERTATGYQFKFSQRWGDCPSGCINGHYWVFDFNARTKRVTKLREYGNPWPIPKSPDDSTVNVPLP